VETKQKEKEKEKEKEAGQGTKSKKNRKKQKPKDNKRKKQASSDSESSDSDSSSSSDSSDGSDSEKEEKEKEKEKEEITLPPEVRLLELEQKIQKLAQRPEDAQDGDMWQQESHQTNEELVGPKPVTKDVALDERSYGGALMPGEGQAIASFVQRGMRIPRRGEVGLSSRQIEDFEKLGFVMSGSRHKRMNAIRIRKENQVYSAEEKRALSLLNMEEKENKEKKLMSDFRKYLLEKAGGVAPPRPEGEVV